MKSVFLNVLLALTYVTLVNGLCTYDVQCGAGGRCENGICLGPPVQQQQPQQVLVQRQPIAQPIYPTVNVQPALTPGTCVRNVDCLPLGIYMKCNKKSRCEKSDHKICLTDNDCTKNWVNKRCINNGCTL